MNKISRKAIVAVVALAMTGSGSAAFAFAKPGAGNSANAPGQANAIENCQATIQRQNANGQTGANTGSENSKKQLDTAVTNCDHFWT